MLDIAHFTIICGVRYKTLFWCELKNINPVDPRDRTRNEFYFDSFNPKIAFEFVRSLHSEPFLGGGDVCNLDADISSLAFDREDVFKFFNAEALQPSDNLFERLGCFFLRGCGRDYFK